MWPTKSGRESTGSPHGDMKTTVGQTSTSVLALACRIFAENSATFLGIRTEVILLHFSLLTLNKQGEAVLPFSAGSHRHRDLGLGAAAPSSQHSSLWYWRNLAARLPPPPTPVSWKKPIMVAHCKSCKAGDIDTIKEGYIQITEDWNSRPHGMTPTRLCHVEGLAALKRGDRDKARPNA